MASRRLAELINKKSISPLPPQNPNNTIITTDPIDPHPTLSLSPSHPSHLARFLSSHLPPSFTPLDLLRFLRRRLRHHPSLAAYDLAVFHWAATIPTFRHDHHTYEFIAHSLISSSRLDPLIPLLRRILSHPCPCSDASIFACPRLEPTFRSAILALSRSSRLSDAASVFDSLRRSLDARPSPSLYNILISAFAKHGRHSTAVEWYHKMIKDRVSPDAYTFNILIGSACRGGGGGFEEASDWLREMKAKGCEPNVVSFNTLIMGLFREGRFDEGIGVTREMLDLGCGFTVATCEILVHGLCRVGRVGRAGDIMMEFLNKGVVPEEFDCLELVAGMCANGQEKRALELVDSMWEMGNSPSVVACTTLIEGLRNLGRIDEAYKVTERMIDKGMVPDTITCNCLFEALCNVGRTMDANRLRVLASKKGLEPDGVMFSILARGFSREGRRREGEGVVDEMLDAGFITNIATYNQLIAGFQSRKKFNNHRRQVFKVEL